jgi:hypothetical protein
MQTCGFPDARWDVATNKLTLCYELAVEFADLYRDYGGAAADGTKRKKIGASAHKPIRNQRGGSHQPIRNQRGGSHPQGVHSQ